jgi:hypothetical protein
VNLEKFSDDLWFGAKDSSNWEISGSPRNIFGYGLGQLWMWGRALNGLGALPGYQTQSNSEYASMYPRAQTVGSNLHRQKGKNPDQQLRSPKYAQWKRK